MTKIQYFTASQYKRQNFIQPFHQDKLNVSAIIIAIPFSYLPFFPITPKHTQISRLMSTYLLHKSSTYSTVRTETTLMSKVMMIWIEISEWLFQSRHLRSPINIKEFIFWIKYLHCSPTAQNLETLQFSSWRVPKSQHCEFFW